MALGARILLCVTALMARALYPSDIVPAAAWILTLVDVVLYALSGWAAIPGSRGREAAAELLAACADGLGLALVAAVPGPDSPWRTAVQAVCAALVVLFSFLPPARPEERSGTKRHALASIFRGLSAAAASSLLGASARDAVAPAIAGAVGWAASSLAASEANRPNAESAGRPLPRRRPHKADERLQELLLSTLAHEIRTPLTIMQTAGNILLEETPGSLNDRQKKFLESICVNQQRLINFSETVLTAIKLDRNIAPDRSKAIDLRLVVRQVAETMRPLLSQRSQRLQCAFPALLFRPMADEAWIRQALVNLVHNASKHTPQGGSVMISLTQDERQVVVTVTDNGGGLSGPGREALFGEFYQEKPNSLSGLDGFGLGLTIVRSMIEAHGGAVRISGSPGHGTMVSFTLPVEARA